VAVVTNDNPSKHNAFDDAMDARLFEIVDELARSPEVRAVVWRGEGKSWSSGRDVSAIGTNLTDLTHHQLMTRGHRGIQRLWQLEAPVIVACKGWTMGGSFQRALLCDIRIADTSARFRLPELGYGVIPDTGGVGVLYQMCGHGLVSDMVLTGRTLSAEEALSHGIVSRVVPPNELDATAIEMAGPWLAGKYRDYAKWGQDKVMPEDETFDQDFDDLLESRFVLGSPEECYEQLRPYWEEFGVNHLTFRTHWAGMPLATALHSIRTISDDLLPELKKL